MARGLRLRHWVPRLAIFLLAGLAAAMVVAPAGAQSTQRPFSWTGNAGAFGIGIQFNTDPTLVPIEELVRGEFPQADSEWLGSGIIRARAASLYPGSSGTGGPSLMCDFGMPCGDISAGLGVPFPPQYPLVAEAQHPSNPSATSQDGLARADVGPDGIVSVASVTDNEAAGGFLGVLGPLVSIGSAEARTSQQFEEGGELVVEARAFVSDVTLPGGLFHIGSVSSFSRSRADGEEASTEASLRVSNASLAGIPVTVSDRGLAVDETVVGPLGAAEFESGLDLLEKSLNFEIRTIGPQFEETELGSSGSVTGLLIRMDVPISNPGLIDLPSIPFPPEAPFPGDPNAFLVTYKVTLVLASSNSLAHANNATFGDGIDVFIPPVGTQPEPGGTDGVPPIDVGAPPGPVGGGQVPSTPGVQPPVTTPGGPSAPGVAAPSQPTDPALLANFLTSLGLDEIDAADIYWLVVVWALIMFVPFRLLRFVERRTRPAPITPSP